MTPRSPLASEVERLAHLTIYIDRLSAGMPLSGHPGLRAQMRRSAMDAISHAACAAEATSPEDYHRLMLRTLTALGELETFTRMGATRDAVTPSQASRIALLVSQATHSLRLSLREQPASLSFDRLPSALPESLSGAA